MFLLIPASFASDWVWSGPEVGFPPSADPVVADDCRWSIEGDSDTTLSCPGWERRTQDFVGGAALATTPELLVVASFSRIASGATLTVYDRRSGQERWSRALTGLGPIGHSEYYNGVEIRVVDETIEVFGWEAHGRYIERVSLADGVEQRLWREEGDRWVEVDVPSTPAWEDWWAEEPSQTTSVPWVWPTEGSQDLPRTDVSGDCTWAGTMDDSKLTCPAFHIHLGDWGDSASIEQVEDVLYVVWFHPIATGARVEAYALDGRRIWRQGLWGCGPVSHSKYRNEVELRVGPGGVVVTGRESSCRYVEVLDPGTGALRGHREEPR